MKTSFALAALAAATIIGGSAIPRFALAQSVPEGQSCGGLLCDMGVFGHKTEPKPAPAAAAPVVEKRAETPAAKGEAAESAEARPKRRTAQHKKRVAKVRPATEVAPETQPPKPLATRAATRAAPAPNVAATPIYAPPPATAGDTPTFAATMEDPAPKVAPAPPAAPRPTVAAAPARPRASEPKPTPILDPFGQTPANAPFRSLY